MTRVLRYAICALVFWGGMGPLSPARADSNQVVKDTWISGLQSPAAQITAGQVQSTGMVGTLYDGTALNNAILSAQTQQASAYRDFTPGEGLCRFGTLSRSLAASNMAADRQSYALDNILLNRETGNGPHGSPFDSYDRLGKLRNLSTLYCNPGDNDGAPPACACDLSAGTCSGPIAGRSNRDLDFARLLGSRLTLDVNWADGTMTPDEQDVLGLLTTVSAFPTLPNLSSKSTDLVANPGMTDAFQNARVITARRGLTRATLSHYVGNRAQGGGSAVSPYMIAALQELGLSAKDAARYLQSDGQVLTANRSDATKTHAPSYTAQMEILTKKIYENPNFYTFLMDKPANIERVRAAQLAVRLMQRRDLYESLTRREILLSQLLESRLKTEESRTRTRLAQAKAYGD